MAKLYNYPITKDINFTTTEQKIVISDCYSLIILPEEDCLISLNNNLNYKKYLSGVAIPIELDSQVCEPIRQIFIKGSKAGVCGIWGFR